MTTKTEKQGWIGWLFFSDMLNGLSLTLGYMFSKTVTMRYPDHQKWIPYPRYRGHHHLRKDENGENKCVACELCARICPCYCITVVPHEVEGGQRRPKIFDIDTSRCMFCGLCEDACPVEAIALGQHYEFCAYEREELFVNCDDLLAMPGKALDGGSVVNATYTPENKARTVTDEKRGYDWWRDIRRK